MKKIFILFLCSLIVFTPYSFDFKALVSAQEENKLEVNNNPLIEDYDFEYLSETDVLIEKLETQVESIEKSLEDILAQEVDGELQTLVEEIKLIDIEAMVVENLIEKQEDLGLENVNDLIDTLTVDDIDKVIDNESIEDVVIGNEIFDDEVIDDEVIDYEMDSSENMLIESNISLNIVETQGEETITRDIEELVEDIVLEKGNVEKSIFKKNTGSASNSGYGYFFAAHNVAITDMKTEKSKFLNIGTITSSGGILKPTSFSMNLVNKRKTTSSGGYVNDSTRKVSKAVKKKDYVLESSIKKTYFWNAEATFVGTFKDGSKDTVKKTSNRFLLNKKGVPYPVFKDPKSGKKMIEPATTTWTKKYYPEKWNTAKRNKYIEWYNPKYGKLKWTEYHVHHIRPRVYYGSNEYANLIPLKSKYHTGVVSPWWTNY